MCHTAHLQERMLGFYVNWIEREAHCLSNGAWLTVGVKCVPIFWAPLALEMWLGNLLTRISSLHPPPHMRTAEERPEWCDLPGGVFRSLSQGSVFSLWERLFLIQFYLHVKGIIYLVLNYFFLEDSTERSCVCTCTHPHSHTHYF